MPSLISPPTDNLYKFMAVGGIALIIAGFLVPPSFFLQSGQEYLTFLRGHDELRVHEKFTKLRLETLSRRREQAEREKAKLLERRSKLTFSAHGTSVTGDIDQLDNRIKEIDVQLESIWDASYQASLDLELKQAQDRSEETVSINQRRNSVYFMVGGWVIGVFGIVLTFFGMLLWKNRLQVLEDRKLRKEAEEDQEPKKIEAAPAIQKSS